MKRKISILTIAVFLFLLRFGLPQAHAYTHPCIPDTVEELATIKANLNQQPWKAGYAQLSGDSHSQLTYNMQGPFATVKRNPDLNLNQWRNDMRAVYSLARMWYFTGNTAYAQKAHDILIAWANTQTSFGGNESGLDLGDYAVCFAGGADILRGTWPGWTDSDTTTVKSYFLNCLWPGSLASGNVVLGPANKGSLYMIAGIAIAVFCDDTAKFDSIINSYRTVYSSGLPNTLATGEMGETGRDLGHAYVDLLSRTLVAEVAWKQGVDLYSESDNRLLACGEYYARNNLETGTPFVPFGTIDYHYFVDTGDAGSGWTANSSGFYLLENAYKNRKNLPTPWMDRKLDDLSVNGDSFMYFKSADFSTATPPAAINFPGVSLASSGLTLTTLGSRSTGRDASYANGVWTVTGLGNGPWTDTYDDCQFVYKQMTGDCAMVAQVTSCTYSGSNGGKAGLMIRDNLIPNVVQRGWVGIVPAGTTLFESHMRGWTQNWGGTGWDDRSQPLPPGMPYWLKIERRGNLITTFASQDGTSWAPVNCSYYGNLPSNLYIGLFVSSGTTTPNTATFAHVAFTGGTGGLVTTPDAPAALLASGSSKAVTVRWLPSFGATAYDLLRSTTSGSGYAVIASNLTTAKTSYVDMGVSAGTNYYYVVRAKNAAGTSGNSPEFDAALLPPPLVKFALSGTASSSMIGGPTWEAPDQAFDGNIYSKWYNGNSTNPGPTGWLQFDFGAGYGQVVKRYTITSADVATRDPKDWNFLGSQDGSTWTTLDTQTSQSFAARTGTNTYDIANTTAYRFYRLEITANNGAASLAVAELGLWGNSGRVIPDGTYNVVSHKSNKLLDLAGAGTADGTDAVLWGWTGGDSQKWTFTYLGSDQYQITGLASGKLLEVTGGSTSNGAAVQIWPSINNNRQKWTVTPTGDGTYKLLNVNSGKAIDVSGGSTANGAAIIQWPYSGADNQLWQISTAP